MNARFGVIWMRGCAALATKPRVTNGKMRMAIKMRFINQAMLILLKVMLRAGFGQPGVL